VSEPRDQPTVAVVGAGLAGLACADRLAGSVNVAVFEASDRIGGRCWSSHGWANGHVGEHGGELIEAGQTHILDLVDSLGLELEDRRRQVPASGAFHLDGHEVDLASVTGFPAMVQKLSEELEGIPGVTADVADHRTRALDEMTVTDWLDVNVEGGSAGTTGRAIDTLVALNLGFSSDSLSALSLHHAFVGLSDPGSSESFAFGNESAGHSDDNAGPSEFSDVCRAAVTHTLHVRGGNDLLAKGLAAKLGAGALHLQSPVVAVSRRSDGRYSVSTAARSSTYVADRIVFANPLPTLRDVDLEGAGLSARRREAIDTIDMGSGFKVMMQLRERTDALPTWQGFSLGNAPPVVAWDSSAGQPGPTSILTFFGQGSLPEHIPGGHGVAPTTTRRYADEIFARLVSNPSRCIEGDVWVDAWADDPWARGSYSGYGPGQYSRFSGFLSMPESGIHWAGEHTSLSSPGYLDGAIASGQRAADEILSRLGLRIAPRS
jgi:monoamine oxidase